MTQLGLFGKTIEKSEVHVFFDTETTGLPLNWNAPTGDVDNWPRLVQIAWSIYEDGRHVKSRDVIIKPEDYVIPADTAQIHGITTERALKEGFEIQPILQEFKEIISNADFLVAHNMGFDEKIMSAEFLRAGMKNFMDGNPSTGLRARKAICTKEISTAFCAIANGRGGFKWPKLSELHAKLFNTHFQDYHNARADVDATAKCFWEMKRRNII